MRTKRLVLTAALILAACDNDPAVVIVDPDPPDAPRELAVAYTWVHEDFTNGQPVGYPAVDITWLPPASWNGEVFRVYGKLQSSANFSRIATVTSCTTAGCVYRDRDVRHGQIYEYYVATGDETTG